LGRAVGASLAAIFLAGASTALIRVNRGASYDATRDHDAIDRRQPLRRGGCHDADESCVNFVRCLMLV